MVSGRTLSGVRIHQLIARVERRLDGIESRLARIDNRVERLHDRSISRDGAMHPQTQRLLDRLDGVGERRGV